MENRWLIKALLSASAFVLLILLLALDFVLLNISRRVSACD